MAEVKIVDMKQYGRAKDVVVRITLHDRNTMEISRKVAEQEIDDFALKLLGEGFDRRQIRYALRDNGTKVFEYQIIG